MLGFAIIPHGLRPVPQLAFQCVFGTYEPVLLMGVGVGPPAVRRRRGVHGGRGALRCPRRRSLGGIFTGVVSLMMGAGPLLLRCMPGVVLIVVVFECFYLLGTTLTN